MGDILQQIIELAQLLEWGTAAVQDRSGTLRGMYVGDKQWLESKVGTSTSVTH